MPAPFATVARRGLLVAVAAVLALGASAALASAQEGTGTAPDELRVVEILPLRGGFIDPPVSAQIGDVLDLAERDGSELVVLQYSSAGGVSLDLAGVLARMERSTVPIAVLVGPLGSGAEAAGAAGLLWLAADARAVSADATVGPLEPADLAGTDFPVAERTAELVEAAGGSPALTARLLEDAVPADELVEGGVVTLTAQGLEPLLVELDGVTVITAAGERELRVRAGELDVRFHSLGLLRRLLHAATTAPFVYLLLVIGLGMVAFEIFQPGFGVAGLAGVVTTAVAGFGLTVLPVTWWAVALVVLGLVLYALDTALAGLGPLTVVATVAMAVGSLFFYDADPLALPWWLVAATVLTALIFFVLVMTTVLRAQAGPEGLAVEELVGRPGIVRSVLNPEGHVYIDGALWRARWTGETRRAKVGTPVRVHAVDGPVVLVEPFDPAAEPLARASDSSTRASG